MRGSDRDVCRLSIVLRHRDAVIRLAQLFQVEEQTPELEDLRYRGQRRQKAIQNRGICKLQRAVLPCQLGDASLARVASALLNQLTLELSDCHKHRREKPISKPPYRWRMKHRVNR